MRKLHKYIQEIGGYVGSLPIETKLICCVVVADVFADAIDMPFSLRNIRFYGGHALTYDFRAKHIHTEYVYHSAELEHLIYFGGNTIEYTPRNLPARFWMKSPEL